MGRLDHHHYGNIRATCVPRDISLDEAYRLTKVAEGLARFCAECGAWVWTAGEQGATCRKCGAVQP